MATYKAIGWNKMKGYIDITNKPLLDLHNFCIETGIKFNSIEQKGDRVYACVIEVEEVY